MQQPRCVWRGYTWLVLTVAWLATGEAHVAGQGTPAATAEGSSLPAARVDGTGPGWEALGPDDFTGVNGDADTWTWQGTMLRSSGLPIGVIRTRRTFTNFELVVEWRHLRAGGNSGVFAWVPANALQGLPPGKLPDAGIEVQILDHAYRQQYEHETGKTSEWFTTHGDVFPVGRSKLVPFEPRSPNGQRSFPRKELSRAAGQWNHYYVRAINGEIRLWVNGEEVSGGSGAEPRTGYLCLEAEGAPIEFRNVRVRMLP